MKQPPFLEISFPLAVFSQETCSHEISAEPAFPPLSLLLCEAKENLPKKFRMIPVEIPYDSRVSSVRISFLARSPLILQVESLTQFSHRASEDQMK